MRSFHHPNVDVSRIVADGHLNWLNALDRIERYSDGERFGSDILAKHLNRGAQFWRVRDDADLDPIGPAEKTPPKSRDVFVYMINGFKPKAPVAAEALIERL